MATVLDAGRSFARAIRAGIASSRSRILGRPGQDSGRADQAVLGGLARPRARPGLINAHASDQLSRSGPNGQVQCQSPIRPGGMRGLTLIARRKHRLGLLRSAVGLIKFGGVAKCR